jgi:hypothetical protein
MDEARMFFFEKKNQKTFVSGCGVLACCRATDVAPLQVMGGALLTRPTSDAVHTLSLSMQIFARIGRVWPGLPGFSRRQTAALVSAAVSFN